VSGPSGASGSEELATHRAIEAVWRMESAKVIAVVARMVRDVSLAEEFAQDALIAALEHWRVDGVPDNPGAWLMTTAKHRALDRLRQDAETQFEYLYYGAVPMVADDQVARAVDAFVIALDQTPDDKIVLSNLSMDLARACRRSLGFIEYL